MHPPFHTLRKTKLLNSLRMCDLLTHRLHRYACAYTVPVLSFMSGDKNMGTARHEMQCAQQKLPASAKKAACVDAAATMLLLTSSTSCTDTHLTIGLLPVTLQSEQHYELLSQVAYNNGASGSMREHALTK